MKTDTEPYSQSKALQLHRWQRQIFSDTISQIPGMTGEARDTISAYTQVNMVDASKLLQVPEAHCPEIWISDKMDDPVVHLEKNSFGHPLASLLWERK